ncbi:MAG: tetratricopeptide repeat protein [Caulobacteraceae bacterium]
MIAVAAFCAASTAYAVEAPVYRASPDWVKAIPIPQDTKAAGDQMLLQSSQVRFAGPENDVYEEAAYKLKTAQDLSGLGSVAVTWKPDTETLVIHTIEIIRDGQVIDKLQGGKAVQVLRRETNLEMAVLDGTLTAIVQPDGLQVGDVIHFAYTHEIRDPVLRAHAQAFMALPRAGKVGRAYFRAIWPTSKPVRWRVTDGLGVPVVQTGKDGQELVVDMRDVEAPQPPRGAPARYGMVATLQLSDFPAWSDVSTQVFELFDKASTLSAGSPLHAEAAKIKAQFKAPEAQASAALQLVEEKTRYLLLGLDNSGYVPAQADDTWTRRYGDCKAKTALLLALLKELGISARPVLVLAQGGDILADRLPSMDAFDHVALRATINSKSYWLDGTRLGDTSLDDLMVPNYRWGLPLQVSGGALEKLEPAPYARPHIEMNTRLDVTAGIDKPAVVHIEHLFRGDEGLALETRLQSLSKTDLDVALRSYWRFAAPWMTPKTVAFSERSHHEFTLLADGSGDLRWGDGQGNKVFFVNESNLGSQVNVDRESGPDHDAPFGVDYPAYFKGNVTVVLPNGGKDFILGNNQEIKQTLAGIEYRRSAHLENGVVQIELSMRAVATEFPYSEAGAAAKTLVDWSSHPVSVILDGALVAARVDEVRCIGDKPDVALVDCVALAAASKPDTSQRANAYLGLAGAYLAKEQWDSAIENYSKTLEIDKDNAAVLERRGYAYAKKGDQQSAIRDYSDSIKANPNASASLIRNRAIAYENIGDIDRALADYSKSLEIKPGDADNLFSRAMMYRLKKDWPNVVANLDKVIAVRPKDAGAYSYRGEANFAQAHYMDAAADFDSAAQIEPQNAIHPLNRGLAQVYLKQDGRAIVDFGEAIRLDPSALKPRFERGKAFARLEKRDEALADYSEAIRINPGYAPAFTERALIYADRADYELALADDTRALAYTPKDFILLRNRGLVYAAKKDHARAIEDFTASLKVKPDYADALNSRGFSYQQQGQSDLALADYSAALKISPDHRFALGNRANVLAARADYAAAIVDLDHLVRLDPGQARTFVRLADVALAAGDTARAEAAIAQALKVKGDEPSAFGIRADIHFAKGDVKAALADLERVSELLPNNAAALNSVCWQRATHGVDLDVALARCDAALKVQPNAAPILDSRGLVHFRRGEYQAALGDLDVALKIAPKQAASLYVRGLVYRKLGRSDAAQADFAAARAISPKIDETYLKMGLSPDQDRRPVQQAKGGA